MSDWKVIQSPQSKSELTGIYNYISQKLLAPETAVKQVLRIIEKIKELANMPLKFSLYDEEPWRSKGLRKFPVDNYVVFYLPNETTKEVIIFHVFYGGQNISDILKNE